MNLSAQSISLEKVGEQYVLNSGDNFSGQKDYKINKELQKLNFTNGQANLPASLKESKFIYIKEADKNVGKLYNTTGDKLRNIPLWLSLIPPLIAIFLALIIKEVLISLFIGIWSGVFILYGFSLKGFFSSLFTTLDTYVVDALADKDHLSIIVFSMLIGGMVAIVSRNGGMRGIVDSLSKYANSHKNAQLVTWAMGLAIFFDDYANTLVVGNTMRPITDKFKVSREKLAYIVDSTAAPIAAIAFVTTWIGAELGYISDALVQLNIDTTAYSVFLSSLGYSFYPVFTIFFVLFLIVMKKDYGPMYKAERRAIETGAVYETNTNRGEDEVDNALEEFDPVPNAKPRWYNALIPVAVVVIGTIIGLLYTGWDTELWNSGKGFLGRMSDIIGNSNSYAALLWSSISAVIAAIALTLGGRIMSVGDTMETLADGFKTMLPAILILVLAWALGQVTKDLYTADFLTGLLDGFLAPKWIPAVTFIMAAMIAFSTGSSWSTMAILYPLMLPATWNIAASAGLPPEMIMPIFHSVTACVLAGSVLGDHCSPISDTTILSSLASSCNHLDHVKTQLPYAATVGGVSILMTVLSMFIPLPGVTKIIWFILGLAVLWAVVKFVGKKTMAE